MLSQAPWHWDRGCPALYVVYIKTYWVSIYVSFNNESAANDIYFFYLRLQATCFIQLITFFKPDSMTLTYYHGEYLVRMLMMTTKQFGHKAMCLLNIAGPQMAF